MAGFERLEPRTDVATFWFDGAASVLHVTFGDDNDWQGSSIGVWYGADAFVTVNGDSSQWIPASGVQKIAIELGSGFGQTGSSSTNLDLQGTADPAFSSLAALDLIFDMNADGSGPSPVLNYDGPLAINLFHVLDGGSGDNVLTGGSQDNWILNSFGGANELFDGGARNTLNGGGGTDILQGGGGEYNLLNGGTASQELISHPWNGQLFPFPDDEP